MKVKQIIKIRNFNLLNQKNLLDGMYLHQRLNCQMVKKNHIYLQLMSKFGKDTHIRQVKIFGPREKHNQGLCFPDFKTPEITQYASIR